MYALIVGEVQVISVEVMILEALNKAPNTHAYAERALRHPKLMPAKLIMLPPSTDPKVGERERIKGEFVYWNSSLSSRITRLSAMSETKINSMGWGGAEQRIWVVEDTVAWTTVPSKLQLSSTEFGISDKVSKTTVPPLLLPTDGEISMMESDDKLRNGSLENTKSTSLLLIPTLYCPVLSAFTSHLREVDVSNSIWFETAKVVGFWNTHFRVGRSGKFEPKIVTIHRSRWDPTEGSNPMIWTERSKRNRR